MRSKRPADFITHTGVPPYTMSTRQAGLPRIALHYWREFAILFAGIGFYVGVLGGLSLAGVAIFLSDAGLYLALAVVGLVVHTTAFGIRDLWTGRLDLDAAGDLSVVRVEIFLLAAVLGVYINTVLFGATYAATSIASASSATTLSLATAMYLPVVDLTLLRRIGWSPGGLLLRLSVQLLAFWGMIRETALSDVPIIGRSPRHMG